eukprot:gene5788-11690_t
MAKVKTSYSNMESLYNATIRGLCPVPLVESNTTAFFGKTSILFCVQFSDGTVASARLQSIFGSKNVYPIYVSQLSVVTCFHIIADPLTVPQTVTSDVPGYVFSGQVPNDLKLDPTLLHLYTNVSVTSSTSSLTPNITSTWTNDLHALTFTSHSANFKVEISYGVGVRNWGLNGLNNETAIRELNLNLLSIPKEHVHQQVAQSDPSSKTGQMWRQTYSDLGSYSNREIGDICGFANLSIDTSTPSTVQIGNLHLLHRIAMRTTSKTKTKTGTGTEIVTGVSMVSQCLATLYAVALNMQLCFSVHMVRDVVLANDFAAQDIQTGTPQGGNPYRDRGLDGSGQVVGLCDTGVDVKSCFFAEKSGRQVPLSPATRPIVENTRRKIISYVTYADARDSFQGHGTHVAGTILGYPLTGSKADRGVASGAKLAFFDAGKGPTSTLNIPSLYSVIFPIAYKANALIHSNSWGSYSKGGGSTSTTIELDTFMYDNPYFLAIFAAGNFGNLGRDTITNPGISKNCLTVGATVTNDDNIVAGFSSTGPTFDRRFGVDVLAPGFPITSAAASGGNRKTCAVTSKSGTSMATAVVAGTAALVRQYFMGQKFWASNCNKWYHLCKIGRFTPRASTIKAVLINSAVSATSIYKSGRLGRGPDVYQGYGSITLRNVLPLKGVTSSKKMKSFDLFVQELVLYEGNVQTWNVKVQASDIPLRVTIAWTDKPGVVGLGKQLLNDVDLSVFMPNGNVRYGNGGTRKDSRNTVERVVVDRPKVGMYRVVLSVAKGALTNSKFQVVSLVITSRGIVTTKAKIVPIPPVVRLGAPPLLDRGGYVPQSIESFAPSGLPTLMVTSPPTGSPSNTTPTGSPSNTPTGSPSNTPTGSPSNTPTGSPSNTPTGSPSNTPTVSPSTTPTTPLSVVCNCICPPPPVYGWGSGSRSGSRSAQGWGQIPSPPAFNISVRIPTHVISQLKSHPSLQCDPIPIPTITTTPTPIPSTSFPSPSPSPSIIPSTPTTTNSASKIHLHPHSDPPPSSIPPSPSPSLTPTPSSSSIPSPSSSSDTNTNTNTMPFIIFPVMEQIEKDNDKDTVNNS